MMEGAGSLAPVDTFSYVSRVRGDWPRSRPQDLVALVRAAAERNHDRDVSGLLILHRGRFRQWLEGPPAAIGPLRRAIFEDPRHRVLAAQDTVSTRHRRFPDWPLHLLCAPEDVDLRWSPVLDHVTFVPKALLEARGPAPVSIPLAVANCAAATLCPAREACLGGGRPATRQCPAEKPICSGRAFGLPDPLLLASAAVRGPAALRSWLPRPEDRFDRAALADVVEAAIDRLGEAWRADRLSDAEVTLALAELYRVLRPLCDARPVWRPRARVLIASLPGSPAVIGPMLEADLLIRAGFDVIVRHGLDTAELERSVDELAADVLVIAASRPFVSHAERVELVRVRESRGLARRVGLVVDEPPGAAARPWSGIVRAVEAALGRAPLSQPATGAGSPETATPAPFDRRVEARA
jgi:hypothetical protein